MSLLAEATEIVTRVSQVRVTEPDALEALELVTGQTASQARTRLRYGPGKTYEQVARVLDRALFGAERRGLSADQLVVTSGSAVAGEDIVRIRRKAHGVADWISSPTSEVTLVLRPKGLVDLDAAAGTGRLAPQQTDSARVTPPVQEQAAQEQAAPETEAELAIREALYEVIDPDLGVNVVDLGFVRGIHIDAAGHATIRMTLTSPACPLTPTMERHIAAVLAPSGTRFEVRWEWLPSWRPADITPDGREQLRAIGFSAF